MPSRAAALLLAALALAHVASAAPLRTAWGPEEAAELAAHALNAPDLRRLAQREAAWHGEVLILVWRDEGAPALLSFDGERVRHVGSAPRPNAYEVRIPRAAALAALNDDDPLRVLRCLAAEGVLSGDAPRVAEDAAARLAARRAARGLDCRLDPGDEVAFRGQRAPAAPLEGGEGALAAALPGETDLLVLNRWGAPLGWLPPGAGVEALSRLSLADARALVAALSAEEREALLAQARADPWGAAWSPAAQRVLAESLDALCLAPCPPAPAPAPPEWREVLAMDPRAQEARA